MSRLGLTEVCQPVPGAHCEAGDGRDPPATGSGGSDPAMAPPSPTPQTDLASALLRDARFPGGRRLPINPSPPLVGKLRHAYPLSILSLNTDYLPWFYSNHIQLFVDSRRGFPSATLDFIYPPDHPSMPLLSVARPAAGAPGGADGFCEFVGGCVEQGQYVELYVDEYHIPDRDAFRARHFIHRLLVFGYDDRREVFDAIGFLPNGGYGVSTVTCSELRDAYWCEERVSSSRQRAAPTAPHEIRLFRHESHGRCRLDVDQIRGFLSDYLVGRDSHRRSASSGFALDRPEGLGMGVYECLRRRFDYWAEHPELCDFLSMHVLWEHKRCMRERVEYLLHRGVLSRRSLAQAALAIEGRAWTLRMAALRLQMTLEARTAERAGNLVLSLAALEAPFLECLLEDLGSHQRRRQAPGPNL